MNETEYEAARDAFLQQCAYMVGQNDKFAADKGGEPSLDENARRIYDGRKRRILTLVQYHDHAQAYIAFLIQWNNHLTERLRQQRAKDDDASNQWRQELASKFPRYPGEAHKEHRRMMSITAAKIQMPHLF